MSNSSGQNPSSTQNNPSSQASPTSGKHSTVQDHPSSQTHHLAQGHSYKNTIEHFADALNGNHLNIIEKYLDNHVEKSIDSQVIYKNLKEARDYYTKEHANNKTAHWKVSHFNDDDQKGNAIKAKVTYNNKTYNTTYTFSASGKIQRIDAHTDINQNTSNTNQ
jgi:hypothetical protein